MVERELCTLSGWTTAKWWQPGSDRHDEKEERKEWGSGGAGVTSGRKETGRDDDDDIEVRAGRSIHTTGELRAKAMAAGRAARLRDLSMAVSGKVERGEG